MYYLKKKQEHLISLFLYIYDLFFTYICCKRKLYNEEYVYLISK